MSESMSGFVPVELNSLKKASRSASFAPVVVTLRSHFLELLGFPVSTPSIAASKFLFRFLADVRSIFCDW